MASTSQNLPSLNELSEILAHISPNDYETWFKVMIACGRAYNQDPSVFSVCQTWAKSYQNRNAQCEYQEKTAFFKSSQRHDGVNIGWLINEAKRGGYASKKEFNDIAQSVVIGEIKRPLNDLITSKVESLINGDSTPEQESAKAIVSSVRETLNFWVFNANSFSQERIKFLNENFKAFDSLIPGASSVYFKALASYCDYLQSSNIFDVNKFIEWGLANVYGFDGSELYALCDIDFGATFSSGIRSPAEAIDKFSSAMQDSAMLVTYEKLQQLAKQCSKFCQISSKEEKAAIKSKIQRDINQLGPTITLGDSLLESILGEDVAAVSKERTLTALNPDTSSKVYIKTGIAQLDEHIHGYRRGGSTILAAHSGVGKTWYGVDAARNVLSGGGRVIFFSSEMAAAEICQRFTNNVSGVNDDTLKTLYERCTKGVDNPSKAADDFCKVFYNVNQFFQEHPNLSIIAGKNGGLSVEQITQEIAIQSQCGPLDLVVVDYLQNLDNETCNPRSANWERVKNTMEQLNNASRLYDCPMLILAQLNNPNRKASGIATAPNLYDVAEASAVVRDAAAVLLLYKVQAEGGTVVDSSSLSSDLRLSIAKSRFGHQSTQPLNMLRDDGSRFIAL